MNHDNPAQHSHHCELCHSLVKHLAAVKSGTVERTTYSDADSLWNELLANTGLTQPEE